MAVDLDRLLQDLSRATQDEFSRRNSVIAVAQSRPKVVITVFESVRASPTDERAARKAAIAS